MSSWRLKVREQGYVEAFPIQIFFALLKLTVELRKKKNSYFFSLQKKFDQMSFHPVRPSIQWKKIFAGNFIRI